MRLQGVFPPSTLLELQSNHRLLTERNSSTMVPSLGKAVVRAKQMAVTSSAGQWPNNIHQLEYTQIKALTSQRFGQRKPVIDQSLPSSVA